MRCFFGRSITTTPSSLMWLSGLDLSSFATDLSVRTASSRWMIQLHIFSMVGKDDLQGNREIGDKERPITYECRRAANKRACALTCAPASFRLTTDRHSYAPDWTGTSLLNMDMFSRQLLRPSSRTDVSDRKPRTEASVPTFSILKLQPSRLSRRRVMQLPKARADMPTAASSSAIRGDPRLIICRQGDSLAPSTVGRISLSRDAPSSLMECSVVDTRTVSPRHIESSSDSCALLRSSPCSRE
uniref:Uncharacterized protein n=1 Tax=Anopheles coluzzii TaxID=1518534 RepID=A0A8W7PJU3_ANOCL